MSLLSNLSTDESIKDEEDILVSGGPLKSGLYECTIDAAYLEKAKSGALGLTLSLKTAANRFINETVYLASGDAKGNKNYYERNGTKHYLPGFIVGNAITRLTVGKEINEMETEPKIIKKWSSEVQAQVPTEVPMLTDLLNQKILVGVVEETRDKTQQGDDGKYYPTGETFNTNAINKVFRASDRKTVAEILEGGEAEFADRWLKRYEDKVVDRTDKKSPKAKPKTSAAKPTTSLFS